MSKALRAVSTKGIQMSPGKSGEVPKCPPKLEKSLTQCILSAREKGVRTTTWWISVVAAHLLVGTPAEGTFTDAEGHVVVDDHHLGRHVRERAELVLGGRDVDEGHEGVLAVREFHAVVVASRDVPGAVAPGPADRPGGSEAVGASRMIEAASVQGVVPLRRFEDGRLAAGLAAGVPGV